MRVRRVEQNKEVLLREGGTVPVSKKERILIPIIQTLSKQNAKPLHVYTVPDQVKIQSLLRRVTFPEVPSGNIESLRKQIEHLYAIHQPHSDIHYLLMMIYYHEQKHSKVRKHF